MPIRSPSRWNIWVGPKELETPSHYITNRSQKHCQFHYKTAILSSRWIRAKNHDRAQLILPQFRSGCIKMKLHLSSPVPSGFQSETRFIHCNFRRWPIAQFLPKPVYVRRETRASRLIVLWFVATHVLFRNEIQRSLRLLGLPGRWFDILPDRIRSEAQIIWCTLRHSNYTDCYVWKRRQVP